jgi:hypothetical protein
MLQHVSDLGEVNMGMNIVRSGLCEYLFSLTQMKSLGGQREPYTEIKRAQDIRNEPVNNVNSSMG